MMLQKCLVESASGLKHHLPIEFNTTLRLIFANTVQPHKHIEFKQRFDEMAKIVAGGIRRLDMSD